MRIKKGNREKILAAAIELFNNHGVAHIGTNKIASHLGISPGNLYYHFKGKEAIIRAIFPEISRATEAAILIDDTTLPTEAHLVDILKNWMTVVWEYRFFYTSMVELLRNDPELQALYLARREATLMFIKAALFNTKLRQRQGLPPLDDEGVARIAVNIWIIALNWIRYLQIGKLDADITKEEIAAGADQIFGVMEPYLDDDTRDIILQRLKSKRN